MALVCVSIVHLYQYRCGVEHQIVPLVGFHNGVGEYGSSDEADSYQLRHEHPIPTDGKVPYYQTLIEAYHLT